MESPPLTGELLTLANAHKRLVMDLPAGTAPAYITLRKHAASGRLDKIAVERPGKWTVYPYGELLAMYAPSSANPRSNTPKDGTQEDAAIKRVSGLRESTDRHLEQGKHQVAQPPALASLSIEEITQRVTAELVPVLEKTIAAQISQAFETSLGDVIERLDSVAMDARNLKRPDGYSWSRRTRPSRHADSRRAEEPIHRAQCQADPAIRRSRWPGFSETWPRSNRHSRICAGDEQNTGRIPKFHCQRSLPVRQ